MSTASSDARSLDTQRSEMRSSDAPARRARDVSGRRTIAGLFRDRETAERAIQDLKDAGFRGDQIGIVMRDRNEQGEMVEQTGTHAATGAVSGIVGGGILGGLVGFLLGIGALAIPGIGPVVAGGALASALGVAGGTAAAGAGIGAAAGGIVGALIGMGIPETEARHFEAGVRAGGVLVTVETRGRAQEALEILERNGADTGSEALDAAREANALPAGEAEPRREVRSEVDTREVRRIENSAAVPAAIPVPDVTYRRPTAEEDERDADRSVRPAAAYQSGASAQGRAEHAIERSFGQDTARSRESGRSRTGTSDVSYNLMSIVYHALQGVDTYQSYGDDAERGGDRELARFFRDVQEENRRRAERAKELLRERLNKSESPKS